MNRSKIEWCNFSWNPIRGLCPVDCKTPDGKSYCYARRMSRRFGMNPKLRLSKREVFADMPVRPGAKIFVCSTMELFHPKVMPGWRDTIFCRIAQNPQHIFIILTKMPERIDRPMPDNVWLGASVTGMEDLDRISYLLEKEAKIKFISFEPLLNFPALPAHGINWVIIGKLTGCGKRHDPLRRWIEFLVDMAHGLNYPVFLKNNLREIWGEPLIQEFPK